MLVCVAIAYVLCGWMRVAMDHNAHPIDRPAYARDRRNLPSLLIALTWPLVEILRSPLRRGLSITLAPVIHGLFISSLKLAITTLPIAGMYWLARVVIEWWS